MKKINSDILSWTSLFGIFLSVIHFSPYLPTLLFSEASDPSKRLSVLVVATLPLCTAAIFFLSGLIDYKKYKSKILFYIGIVFLVVCFFWPAILLNSFLEILKNSSIFGKLLVIFMYLFYFFGIIVRGKLYLETK